MNNALITDPIWECYCHSRQGIALVMARDRQTAQLACRQWLNWSMASVCFRAPERSTTFEHCGGHADEPVVYAEDRVKFTHVTRHPETQS